MEHGAGLKNKRSAAIRQQDHDGQAKTVITSPS
jgi:hypothetical protein